MAFGKRSTRLRRHDRAGTIPNFARHQRCWRNADKTGDTSDQLPVIALACNDFGDLEVAGAFAGRVHVDRGYLRDVRMRAEDAGDVRFHLGDLHAESGQTLQGSFSALSKPNFANKYALE